MKKKPTPTSILLRQKAEETLKNTPPKRTSALSEAASIRLIHELEVHQVELEMQYEELELAKKQAADLATDKYAQIYDFAPTGYFTINRLGEITIVNYRGAALLGMERPVLVNRQFSNFVTDDTKTLFSLFLEKVFKTSLKETCEVTLKGCDKTSLYVALYGIAGLDDECLVTAVDITERRQAEKALQESELKYRELIENSPDAIVIYAYGEIIFTNKECLRLMEVDSAEELLGKPVLQFVHPDSREMVIRRMKEASEDEKVLPLYEEVFLRPNGSAVDVEVKAMPVSFENEKAVQVIIRDITERKKVEAQLLRNSKFTEALLESIPIPLFFKDANGLYLGCNEAFCHQMGVTSEGIKGKSVMDLWPTDQANIYLQNDLDLIANPTHQIYESTITDKYSQVRDVILAKNVFYDELGQIAGMVGTFNDITERKQAEKVLRETEERNKAMLEANPDMMFLLDESAKFIDFQAPVQAQPYSPPDSFIGKSITDVLPAEVVELINSQMGKLFETGQMQICNYQLLVNDHPRYYENRLVLCGDSKALSIVRDVTELKQTEDELRNSELKFRELFESNTDGITIFNMTIEGPPSNILDLNENAAKMVGYTREEMKLLTPVEFEKEVTPEKIEKRMHDLLTKGFSEFETIIKHKDGHEINVEIKVVMINYHNQPALMNIVRDITDRKNKEIQLQQYAVELSKQIAEKDKFFSIIAHDLRGPFSAFLELSELMANESSTMTVEDMKKVAGVMKKSAANLFRLLGNLLEWSRMQRGITTFNPKFFALNSRLHEITSLPQEAAFKKGIEINFDFPDELVVFADENMLEGILRNLTANAVKFTNTGGSITVLAKSFPDDSVEFSVKDTGIGMSKNMCDNLFNIDVNTSRKGTSGELSTGLGLLISKDFIEKHNGTLHIESEQGIGSIFSFTIPGHMNAEEKTGNIMPGSVERTALQGRKFNILIAEDEETSDLLISIALNKISREFLHAKTGVEAIEILRNRPDIDLIMMDIQMPEMGGYEATRQIRQFNTNVIIIAQTAYTYSNERGEALKAGCNDYISKPISQSELLELVGIYLK